VAEDAAIVRQLNWQLLERMTQQEMAATAAAASVLKSYAISHVGTELRYWKIHDLALHMQLLCCKWRLLLA
jgi:hypothetical protein